MNAALLNRFRSKDPGWDQLPNLGSETLTNWIRDLETESGWEQDQALVLARNKIEEELRQRQAQEEEAEREAILHPGTPGRPRVYATEVERDAAVKASKARYREKHSKKGRVSAVKRLGQEFIGACTAQGLDPVTELKIILAQPDPIPSQSNVNF